MGVSLTNDRTIFDYDGLNYWVTLPIGSSKLWEINCKIRGYILNSQKAKYAYQQRLIFDAKSKAFVTSVANYVVIQDLLKFHRDNKLPFYATDYLIDKIVELENYDERAKLNGVDLLPQKIPGIKTNLRAYQYTAVKFIADAGGKAIIALGTGTGKTLVSLSYCLLNKKKAIIVCPSQGGKTKRSWAKEIYKHTDKKPLIIWSKTKNDMMQLDSADFIIINYELLDKFKGAILNLVKFHGFDTIIIDESHSIKNISAKRTRSIVEICLNCTGRILLSATAIKNKPDELYSQLNLVAPQRFPNKLTFRNRYFGRKMFKGSKFFYTKQSKAQLELLNKEIQGCYFYRDKMKIIHELPSLIIETINYDYAKAKLISDMNKQQQYQHLAHAMVDNTIKLVDKLLLDEDNKKIIVYSGFVATTEEIKKRLGSIATMNHGQLTSQEQHDNFEAFINNESVKVIVATYQSFSESINLQDTSSVVVFNDAPYVTAQIEQAYGRVYRIGQKNTCFCYLQGFNGTYTDEVFEILEGKDILMSKVLKGEEKTKDFCNQTIKPTEI